MFIKRSKRKVPGLNTTSTADISFMLLVFFLVTSSMDTDKGVARQLPPPENSTEEQDMTVKQRNLIELEIDANDRLTCNKEAITPEALTKRIEEFVANESDDPDLPEMSVREVHLMGRCKVSDRHIISIQVDRNTSYKAYLEMQDAIVRAYNNLRNKLAKKRFGHPYAQCTAEEYEAIALVYPQRISEQPPMVNGQSSMVNGQSSMVNGQSSMVNGIGLQWEGRDIIDSLHYRYPDLHLISSESECGNGQMDWRAGEHTFFLMHEYIGRGCDEYYNWNFILCDQGRSAWGWKQNALVQVRSANRTYRYTPEYYAYKHFSHFVEPGSTLLAFYPQKDGVQAIVFQRPDGKRVIICGNKNDGEKTLSLPVNGQWSMVNSKYLNVTLAPHSFNTFVEK